MARTEVNSRQIRDNTITIDDLNTSISGKAVITKVVAGNNVTLQSGGVDAGTGEVTINVDDNYKRLFI